MTTPRVTGLYRYPIKGLTPEAVDSVDLVPDAGFPFDRMMAIARPDGAYNARDFVPLRKAEYFMLMRDERLAGLEFHLDVHTLETTVKVRGHLVFEGELVSADGIRRFEDFYARVLDLPEGSRPELARQPNYNFSDSAKNGTRMMNTISVINLASVRDFEARVGAPVHPLRFRGNIYIDGLEPWVEREWVGRQVRFGDVLAAGVVETDRCSAIEVDPQTARRDLPLPKLLVQNYGHDIMGVFIEVVDGGTLRVDDVVDDLSIPAPMTVTE